MATHYAAEVARSADLLSARGLEREAILFACEGAFPTIVQDSCEWARGDPVEAPARSALPSWRKADLDLAASEWYFDESTIGAVLTEVGDIRSGYVLCVGVPTLAFALTETGGRVTLVDSSPWISAGPGLDFRAIDFLEYDDPLPPGAVVVMDPPWHLADYASWLSHLSTLVPADGPVSILVAVPERLASGSSVMIRELVFKRLGEMGRIDVRAGWLRYSTPWFEASMLARAGISPRDWRRADLVVARCGSLPRDAPAVGSRSSFASWRSTLIDGAVIRMDPQSPSAGSFEVRSRTDVMAPSRSLILEQGVNLFSSSGACASILGGAGVLAEVLDSASKRPGKAVGELVRQRATNAAVARRIRQCLLGLGVPL